MSVNSLSLRNLGFQQAELCCLSLTGCRFISPAPLPPGSRPPLPLSPRAGQQSKTLCQPGPSLRPGPVHRQIQTGLCSWQELLEHGRAQLSSSPEPHHPLQTPLIGPHLVIREHLPSHPRRLAPSASGKSQSGLCIPPFPGCTLSDSPNCVPDTSVQALGYHTHLAIVTDHKPPKC